MDRTPSTGHREALRRLRRVMAGSGSAQNRLDEIVKVVGFNMPSGGGFSAGLLAGLKQG